MYVTTIVIFSLLAGTAIADPRRTTRPPIQPRLANWSGCLEIPISKRAMLPRKS